MTNLFKKIITFIVITSFLYSNCLYGLPINPSRSNNNTLAWKGLLNQPESIQNMNKLLDISSAISETDDARHINSLRVLFARILGDEPDGLGVFYSENRSEAFVYGREKVLHIYRQGEEGITQISAGTLAEFSESSITVAQYRLADVSDILKTKVVNGELDLIEGIPDLMNDPESMIESARERIKRILQLHGYYKEGRDLEELINNAATNNVSASIISYMRSLLNFVSLLQREDVITDDGMRRDKGRNIHAMYAGVPEGSDFYGDLLFNNGQIPRWQCYDPSDAPGNLDIERRNAIKIRNFIENKGVGKPLQMGMDMDTQWDLQDELGRKQILVWDGKDEKDEELNHIIGTNLMSLFSKMDQGERESIIEGLQRFSQPYGIVIAILDKSRYICENCRGDSFIGINRGILEEIKEAREELSNIEGSGESAKIKKLKKKITALELYLQTYLYHELRHEALVEERKLLIEKSYEDKMGTFKHDMDFTGTTAGELWTTISTVFSDDFIEDLERRQNGHDARFFAGMAGDSYKDYLDVLRNSKVVEMEPLFNDAVIVAGFSNDIGKHHNELRIDNDIIRNNAVDNKEVLRVFKKYENEYLGIKMGKYFKEQKYRGKISYMLYQLGLTANYRVHEWRKWDEKEIKPTDRKKLKEAEWELAKRCMVRLIELMSDHNLDKEAGTIEPVVGIRNFPDTVEKFLTKSNTKNGAFSQWVERTEFSFKTSGLVDTVCDDSSERFRQLKFETCKEQADRGDTRFLGITRDKLKRASVKASIEKRRPRLRIMLLFKDYFSYLNRTQATKFNAVYMGFLNDYTQSDVLVTKGDLKKIDKLYKKIKKHLTEKFGLNSPELEDIFDPEDDDILEMLWSTFDLVENLVPDLDLRFTEPLLGDKGDVDTNLLTKEEIESINELKDMLDNEDGKTVERNLYTKIDDINKLVHMVARLYKKKIPRLRSDLIHTLTRYGSSGANNEKAINLLKKTGGWAGSVWLARELGLLFASREIKNALEINSGLSIFHRALEEQGVAGEGLCDVIGSARMEYFGRNTNRVAGSFHTGDYRSMHMPDSQEHKIKDKSQDLVVSVHDIHKIGNPERVFRMFKEANRVLDDGRYFAVTMPVTQKFNKKTLQVLDQKMGFVPVPELGAPGITYNVAIRPEAGIDSAEGIHKKGFYLAVFMKTDPVKKDEEELKNKGLLRPVVVRKQGRRSLSDLRTAEREDDGEEEVSVAIGSTEDEGFEGTGSVGGEDYTSGSLANGFAANAQKVREELKAKAREQESEEDKGLFELTLDDLKTAWDEKVHKTFKLKEFTDRDLTQKVEALTADNHVYKEGDLDTLDILLNELSELKDKVKTKAKTFDSNMAKIEELIKALDTDPNRTAFEPVRERCEEIKEYEVTDIFKNVSGGSKLTVYEEAEALLEELEGIQETIRQSRQAMAELDRLMEEDGRSFEDIKRLIIKYQHVKDAVENRADRRKVKIDDVLAIERKEDLTIDLWNILVETDKLLAKQLSNGRAEPFKTLKEFEEAMEGLVTLIDAGFLFTVNDVKFLNKAKTEWQNEERVDGTQINIVAEKGIFTKKNRNDMTRLVGYINISEEWLEKKEDIEWDKGLASLVNYTNEREYLNVLDADLQFSPFMSRQWLGFATSKVINIKHGMISEDVKSAVLSASGGLGEGSNLIMALDSSLSFRDPDSFISALEKAGFALNSIHGIHSVISEDVEYLKDDIKDKVKQFIRREKMVFVFKRRSVPKGLELNDLSFSVNATEEETDIEDLVNIRVSVLSDLSQENVDLKISGKMITKKQIEADGKYNKWKEKIPGWKENQFFLEEVVLQTAERCEKAEADRLAADERRRIDDAARAEERGKKLIKRSENPHVDITYDGIWAGDKEKEAVRDLARILLKVVSDFNAEELQDISEGGSESPLDIYIRETVLSDDYIKYHPVLSRINADDPDAFKEKIKELIKYRQYIWQIRKAYRRFGQLVSSFMPFKTAFNDFYLETGNSKRVLDLISNSDDKMNPLLNWHEYSLGLDESILGDASMEEHFDELFGDSLYLRYLTTDSYLEDCNPHTGQGLKMLTKHYMLDPEGVLKAIGNEMGVNVLSGKDSFRYEKAWVRSSRKILKQRLSKEEFKDNNIHKIEKLLDYASEIAELLGEFCKDRNFGSNYIKDLEHYANLCLSYAAQTGKIDKSKVLNAMKLFIEGYRRLLAEDMTPDEYDTFKRRLDNQIHVREDYLLKENTVLILEEDSGDVVAVTIQPADEESCMDGTLSGIHYLHGNGRDSLVSLEGKDRVVPAVLPRKRDIEAKNYCEAVGCLRNVKLYVISDEEKDVIDGLIKDLFSQNYQNEKEAFLRRIKIYLKTRNTVNRFQYFTNMCTVYLHNCMNPGVIYEEIGNIANEIAAIEPKINAYIDEKRERQSLHVLIVEYYRLMQMMEDDSLKEAYLDIEIDAITINRIIRERMKELQKKWNTDGKESINDRELPYALAAVGDSRYHSGLLPYIDIGVRSIKGFDQYGVATFLSSKITAEWKRTAKDIARELQLVLIYYPEDREIYLRDVARAIVNVKKEYHSMIKISIDEFMKILRNYLPRDAIREIERYRSEEAGVQSPYVASCIVDVLGTNLFSKEQDESEDDEDYKMVMKYIETDQAFRVRRISSIYDNYNDENCKCPKEEMEKQIRLVIENAENPHEIYCMLKVMIHGEKDIITKASNRSDGSDRGVLSIIFSHSVRKFVDFINDGREEEIADVMTRTYNEFELMSDFIVIALSIDHTLKLQDFMIRMFNSDNPKVSAYICYYLEHYMRNYESIRSNYDNALGITGLNKFLVNFLLGVLTKEGDTDKIRMREVFDLLCSAIVAVPQLRLNKFWKDIIKKYEKGDISEEAISAIDTNVNWVLDELCQAIEEKEATKTVEDIRKRFALTDKDTGENIFEKAIKEKKGAGEGEVSFISFDLGLSVFVGLLAVSIVIATDYFLFSGSGIVDKIFLSDFTNPWTIVKILCGLISPWFFHEIVGHRIIGWILSKFKRYPKTKIRLTNWGLRTAVIPVDKLKGHDVKSFMNLKKWVARLGPNLNVITAIMVLGMITSTDTPIYLLILTYVLASNLTALISLVPTAIWLPYIRYKDGIESDGDIIIGRKIISTPELKIKKDILKSLEYNKRDNKPPLLTRKSLIFIVIRKHLWMFLLSPFRLVDTFYNEFKKLTDGKIDSKGDGRGTTNGNSRKKQGKEGIKSLKEIIEKELQQYFGGRVQDTSSELILQNETLILLKTIIRKYKLKFIFSPIQFIDIFYSVIAELENENRERRKKRALKKAKGTGHIGATTEGGRKSKKPAEGIVRLVGTNSYVRVEDRDVLLERGIIAEIDTTITGNTIKNTKYTLTSLCDELERKGLVKKVITFVPKRERGKRDSIGQIKRVYFSEAIYKKRKKGSGNKGAGIFEVNIPKVIRKNEIDSVHNGAWEILLEKGYIEKVDEDRGVLGQRFIDECMDDVDKMDLKIGSYGKLQNVFTNEFLKKHEKHTDRLPSKGNRDRIYGILKEAASGDKYRIYQKLVNILRIDKEDLKYIINWCTRNGSMSQFYRAINSIIVFHDLFYGSQKSQSPLFKKQILPNEELIKNALLWRIVPMGERPERYSKSPGRFEELVRSLNFHDFTSFDIYYTGEYNRYVQLIDQLMESEPQVAIMLFCLKFEDLLTSKITGAVDVDLRKNTMINRQITRIFKPYLKKHLGIEVSSEFLDGIFKNASPDSRKEYIRIEKIRKRKVNDIIRVLRNKVKCATTKGAKYQTGLIRDRMRNKIRKELSELEQVRRKTDKVLPDISKIEIKITFRIKGIWNIYDKLIRNKKIKDVAYLFDLLAFRVVICDKAGLNDEEKLSEKEKEILCYHILGIIKKWKDDGKKLFNFVPFRRFIKGGSINYIKERKPNDYQSLNTKWWCGTVEKEDLKDIVEDSDLDKLWDSLIASAYIKRAKDGEMKLTFRYVIKVKEPSLIKLRGIELNDKQKEKLYKVLQETHIRFEIQVRTEKMDHVAEYGTAAFSEYKLIDDAGQQIEPPKESIVIMYKEIEDDDPQGDYRLVRLPEGATVADLLCSPDVNAMSRYGEGSMSEVEDKRHFKDFSRELKPGDKVILNLRGKREGLLEYGEIPDGVRILPRTALSQKVNDESELASKWKTGLVKIIKEAGFEWNTLIMGEDSEYREPIKSFFDRGSINHTGLFMLLTEACDGLYFANLLELAVYYGFVEDDMRAYYAEIIEDMSKEDIGQYDLSILIPVAELLTAISHNLIDINDVIQALREEPEYDEDSERFAEYEEFQAMELRSDLGKEVVKKEITYDIDGTKANTKTGIKNIREHIYSEGNKIENWQSGLDLYIDNRISEDLDIPEQEFLEYLNTALEFIPEEHRERIGFKGKLAIALVDTSPTLFIDCRKNGFIGINRVFLDILLKDRSPDRIVSKILLIMGLHHELMHECGIDMGKEDIMAEEGLRVCRYLASQYGTEEYDEDEILKELSIRLKEVLKGDSVFLSAIQKELESLFMDERLRSVESKIDAISSKLEEEGKLKNPEVFKERLNRLVNRLNEGKRIELTKLQVSRLLYLLENEEYTDLLPDIAELADILLMPEYTGDPGMVVMAIEKEILAWLYTEEQLNIDQAKATISVIKQTEERKVLELSVTKDELVRTYKGFRFRKGGAIPETVQNTLSFINDFQIDKGDLEQKEGYVLIDEYWKEKYQKTLDKVTEGLDVKFVTDVAEVPDGKKIIALVDPGDIGREKWKSERLSLFLALPYMEQSFLLAAELATISSSVELKDTNTFKFMKGFYGNILGEELDDSEVISWFTNPLELNDKIKSIKEQLQILRVALSCIDRSA